MKIFFICLSLSIFYSSMVNAQDLLNTRIRLISGRKRSIYFDKGVFHNDGNNRVSSQLKGIRESYVRTRGYERIVFDFSGTVPPAIYGSIDGKNKKIYLDFFNTTVKKNITTVGRNKYLSAVNFFPIEHDALSLELIFKSKVVADIFFLKNPGRLVIDIKK